MTTYSKEYTLKDDSDLMCPFPADTVKNQTQASNCKNSHIINAAISIDLCFFTINQFNT